MYNQIHHPVTQASFSVYFSFSIKSHIQTRRLKAWCHHWQLPHAPHPQKRTHKHTHAFYTWSGGPALVLHCTLPPLVCVLSILNPAIPVQTLSTCLISYRTESDQKALWVQLANFHRTGLETAPWGNWVYGIQGQLSEAVPCRSNRKVLRKTLKAESSHKGTKMPNLRSEEGTKEESGGS